VTKAIARPASRRGASRPAAVLVAVSLGLLVLAAARADDPEAAGRDLAVAGTFVACGAAVRIGAPRGDLTGALLLATGLTWLVGNLADELATLHRGPLAQMLLTAPTGRPRSHIEWLTVTAGYAIVLVPRLGDQSLATAALPFLLVSVAIGRWAHAGGLQRRARAVSAIAATATGAVLLAGAAAPAADAGAVLLAYQVVLVATAVGISVDRRRGGWAQATLTALVVDLGTERAGSLAATLGRAVGDPSLLLGYRRGGGFVDEQGRPVALPGPGADRVVTTIEEVGSSVAVLVHDPVALKAPGLADAVGVAVRLAFANLRLQDDVEARVQDVAASRARLLHARETERAGLQSRLDAGVGRRLDTAADALAGLVGNTDPVVAALPGELERTRAELRRFATGLRPRDLEASGLAGALPALVALAPMPVALHVTCARLAGELETTAWYVCSEALANVAKHAVATRAAVVVARRDGVLAVTVDDDGLGGADPALGRGLRGLAARVEASGGRLQIGPGPGGTGTRLRVTLPVQECG